jgi:hypothetical protein
MMIHEKITPKQSQVRQAKEAAAALAKQESTNAQPVVGTEFIRKMNGMGQYKP